MSARLVLDAAYPRLEMVILQSPALLQPPPLSGVFIRLEQTILVSCTVETHTQSITVYIPITLLWFIISAHTMFT